MFISGEGRLTGEPKGQEVGDSFVVRFSLASNPTWRGATGEWVEGEVVFVRIELWGGPARDAAKTLRKGDLVCVVGELRADTWEAEGGMKRTQFVRASSVGYVGRAEKSGVEGGVLEPELAELAQ